MSDVSLLVGTLAAGALLGTIFFGGLWWTVRNGLAATNPALWFGVSALLRMGSVLSGFYYLSHNGWPSLLWGLCGFLIARAVVTRFTRSAPESRHAS